MELSALIAPVFTLLGTVSGVLLTHRVARDKFVRERLWEQRKDAYGEILASLMDAIGACEAVCNGFNEDGEDYFGTAIYDRRIKETWDAWGEAHRVYVKNSLILSDEFTARFERLDHGLSQAHWDEDIPPDLYGRCLELLRTAASELRPMAVREVNLSRATAGLRRFIPGFRGD